MVRKDGLQVDSILILKGQSRFPGAKFLDKKLKRVESLVVDRIFEPRDPILLLSDPHVTFVELLARATLLHHFHASKSILRFLFFFFSHFMLFWSSQVIVVKNTTPVGRFVKLYLFISLFRSLMSFSMRFFIEYSTFIAVSFL